MMLIFSNHNGQGHSTAANAPPRQAILNNAKKRTLNILRRTLPRLTQTGEGFFLRFNSVKKNSTETSIMVNITEMARAIAKV